MREDHRYELIALGIFTGMMMLLTVSGQSTSAASQVNGGSCTVSFSGSLDTLQMSPAGGWKMTSSACSITDQSGGVTRGAFSGTFTSDAFSGVVSGTWSIAGSTQKVVASSAGFTVSISDDQGVDQTPVVGSALQGLLSGTGSPLLFTVGTVGQVTVK